MILIAIINGTIRQYCYLKYVGELRAHQLSTVTAILFMGAYIWAVIAKWQPTSSRQAILIGLLWLVMTVAFEFWMGRYIGKHPWSELLKDYNIAEGRIWLLLLLWIAIAPCLFYRITKN